MEKYQKNCQQFHQEEHIIQLLSLAAKSLKTTKLTASTDDNIY